MRRNLERGEDAVVLDGELAKIYIGADREDITTGITRKKNNYVYMQINLGRYFANYYFKEIENHKKISFIL